MLQTMRGEGGGLRRHTQVLSMHGADLRMDEVKSLDRGLGMEVSEEGESWRCRGNS